MRAATHRVLSVVLIIFLVVNSFYTRPTLASVSASPTVQPLTVCWVKHWNGTGSTEWHITNPNPVPLSSNPDTKIRYNWRVFSAFNALGSILQSANDWDNGNPNPVNTVYSQSMVVEWYLFTNGSKGGILGNAIANANPGGLCGGSGPTVTPTASKTPTKVPSATLTASKTVSPTLPPTLTFTPSKTATKLPTLTPTVPTLPPTFTFTPTASQTLTFTPTIPTATLTPTVPTLTPTFTASATFTATIPTFTPTNLPTVTNTPTVTSSMTSTSSPTASNTATSTTSATPANSPTGTLVATNTLTATATQDPLTGVTCVDWRDGNAHGWTNSPWENGVAVTWNTSGMVGTSNGTNSTPLAAVYYVLPVGGPYEVVFNTVGNGSYTLAQNASAPVNIPLSNNIPASANSAYVVSQSVIELQWNATTSSTPLTFQSFCFTAYPATATPTASVTSTPPASATNTSTPSATPSSTQTKTPVPGCPVTNIAPRGTIGRIVANNDDWVWTDDTAFRYLHDDTLRFALNVPHWLMNGRLGSILLYSSDTFAISSTLQTSLINAGYQVTSSTPEANVINFTLPNILQYDAIYVGYGVVDHIDNCVLIDYVNAGGSIYIFGGAALDTVIEANAWNVFMHAFGLNFFGDRNRLNETYPVNSSHPVMQGIHQLYMNDGNSLTLLNPLDPHTSMLVTDIPTGLGLIAVYDPIGGQAATVTPTATDGPSPTASATYTPSATSTTTLTPTMTLTPSPTLPALPPIAIQGCIAAPLNRTSVSGLVPVTLCNSAGLVGGAVDYWPADDPNSYHTLASNVNAPANSTIATLDTTLLANDSYVIRVRGQNTLGQTVNDAVLITVVGDYKPGRVRFSVTDLTVPIVGLPITIGRTYDSLNRAQVGDFGNGWALDLGSPQIQVNQAHDVTLTQANGQRVTFYFAPNSLGLGFVSAAYQPEAGVYGKLESTGCTLLIVPAGQYFCFPGPAYQPAGYKYTDPYGRVFVYSVGADPVTQKQTSQLVSVTDLNHNMLTFSQNGITSSTGLNVPFVRDAQNRITQITDPLNNVYTYGYDAAGNLASVSLPSITNPVQYSYDASHLFLKSTDPLGHTPVVASYYSDGRLKDETDAFSNIYRYSYDVPGHVTTTTNPDSGQLQQTFDSYGKLIKAIDPLSRVSQFSYDNNHNLTSETNGAGETTTASYDGQGHLTHLINGLNKTTLQATYNPYGGALTVTNALNTTWTLTYDASFRPMSINDTLGTLSTYGWDSHGSLVTLTDSNNQKTQFSYDQYGNKTQQVNALSNATTYTYDTMGRVLTRKDAVGALTTYGYDVLGHTLSVTDALNGQTTYQYDPAGNRTAIIDRLHRQTGYQFDVLNRVTQITYADGTTRSYTYNFRGQTQTATDMAGHVTRYQYDVAGQLSTTTYADGTGGAYSTSYTYDGAGRQLTQTNGLGAKTSYSYDAAGRLVTMTDPLNRVSSTTYDDEGFRLSTTDPLNRTTNNVYDQRGRLTQTTYADTTFTQYGYDVAGRLLTTTDTLGTISRYTYDAIGQMTKATYADGTSLQRTAQYGYDAVGNQLSATDALGNQSTNTYDPLRRLTTSTDALHNQTTYQYDAVGQLSQIKDPLGYVTTFQYDSVGRQTKTIYPNSTFDQSVYNNVGQLTQSIDQAGHITAYAYDLVGRLSNVTAAFGTGDKATTIYGYNAIGQTTSFTDALGNQSTSTYDLAGQLTSSSDALANSTTYTYDAAGQQVLVTDANGHATHSDYDLLGRLTKTTYADNTFTQNTYDPLGRLMQHTDQAGKPTSYAYDALGQLLHVSNALNQTTSYTYDANGNMLGVTDADAHQTSFGYDALNRQTRRTLPDGNFEAWNYDANGNMTSHQLADSNINTAAYDNLNQVVSQSLFDGQTLSYTYTPNGMPKTVTDGRGVVTYAYDNRDRLTQATQPNGQAVSYTYNAVGNRLSMTTPVNTTNYTYDYDNRVTGVSNSANQGATYTYDKVGLLLQRNLANGVTTDYTYDTLNRLTKLVQHKQGPQAPIASYSYTLGAAGNRLSVTELDNSVTNWTYDDAYRLLSESRSSGVSPTSSPTPGGTAAPTFAPATNTPPVGASATPAGTPTGTPAVNNNTPSWQVNYTYDAVGNRLSSTENGQTTAYQYDTRNRLTSAGTATYQYDPRGNVTQVTDGSTTTKYTWDAQNRLIAANVPGGATASYVYDAGGRRVKQTTAGQSTNYLWDQASRYGDVALETDNNGTAQTNYLMAGNDRVAQTHSGVTSYYLRDGQGSTRALADTNGMTTDRYVYDAFGTLRSHADTTANSYQYAGQQFDSLTGLYDMRARYYSPSIGRFLSADTQSFSAGNPTELNRYAYTADNPINAYDPSGRFLIEYSTMISEQKRSAAVTAGAVAGFASSSLLIVWTGLNLCGKFRFKPADALAFIAQSTIEGAAFGFVADVVTQAAPAVGSILILGTLMSGALSLREPSQISLLCRVGSMAAGFIAGAVSYSVLEPIDLSSTIDSSSNSSGNGSNSSGNGSNSSGNGSSSSGNGSTDPGNGSTDPGNGSTDPGNGSTDPGNGSTDPNNGNPSGDNPGEGEGKTRGGGVCSFSADTPVATDQGEIAIGDLKVGERVLAYDPKTAQTGYFAIDAVLVHTDPVIENLTLDNEMLVTTPEHPFFTQEHGFTAAGKLRVGEHIRKADGHFGVVRALKLVARAQRMYNLTVRSAHTFFVGTARWLVHNICWPTQIQKFIDRYRVDPRESNWTATSKALDDLNVKGPLSQEQVQALLANLSAHISKTLNHLIDTINAGDDPSREVSGLADSQLLLNRWRFLADTRSEGLIEGLSIEKMALDQVPDEAIRARLLQALQSTLGKFSP